MGAPIGHPPFFILTGCSGGGCFGGGSTLVGPLTHRGLNAVPQQNDRLRATWPAPGDRLVHLPKTDVEARPNRPDPAEPTHVTPRA